jgi:hypothetical protein
MGDFFRNFIILFLFGVAFHCPVGVSYSQPSIRFIENKNQWASDIDYGARIPGGKMFVGAGSFSYYFLDGKKLDDIHNHSHEQAEPDGRSPADQIVSGHAVHVTFLNADAAVKPFGIGRSSEYYNYFRGNQREHWASGAYAYEGMLYESLYPGVDMKVYATGENVKYDLIVAPNADPSKIRVSYQGPDKMSLDNGNLHITTSVAEIIEKRPFAYQHIGGKQVEVKCEFNLEGNLLSFVFPEGYDSCYELLIDPLLIFSTYSGSTADNWGSTATPGEKGNLYSSGVTIEIDGGVFPATAGAFQMNSGGYFDIGVLKYDSTGRQLLYATYLGGSNAESPHSLVMNGAEELILLGTTSSDDFATTDGAFDRSFNSGEPVNVVGYDYTAGSDIVITRLSADGKILIASTYVGGTLNDGLNPPGGELTKNYGDQLRGDIITDEQGNIYVSSVTASRDFPVANGFEHVYQDGATDGVLFKMDPDLSGMIWSTYIGGSGTDGAHTIKLGKEKTIFLAGGTTSNDFPVTAGSYQTIHQGGVDGWIAEVASDGSSVLHATFTGTPNYNQVYFIDLNAEEDVYVYGQTAGDFPVTSGVYSNPGSGQFIQKFDKSLSGLLFSSVFGARRGEPDISPTAFLVNECNNLYMAGWGGLINSGTGFWNTGTTGLPVTPDAFQTTTSGSDFYFIVLTDDATEMLYATFLGGTQSRTHVDGGTSRFDKDGIVYHAVCSGCRSFNTTGGSTSDFPTTPGAWSATNNSNNCNNAAFKFDLASLKARLQTNSVKRDMPGLKVVCIPDPIVFENLSTGGEIFQWDLGDGTKLSKTDPAAITHEYQNPGQYLVTLKAIDQGTCQVVDVASTVVTVNTAQSFVQNDDDVCFGSSYRLEAGGAADYYWISADSSFISSEARPAVSPPDTTTYYVTLTEANGCVRKDTVVLNVVPGMTPEFEWVKQPDCLARPEIFVRNLTDSLENTDLLFFDFGDGSTSDQPEATHAFENDGVYTVRLVGQRAFCVYEKSVAIPVFELFIPNVITPGQPVDNDVFTIRYGKVEGVTPRDYGFTVALSIFNRWGRTVYQTNDYQYDWSGEGLAAGVYYFEVSIDGHAVCKSWLQLIK